MLSNFDPHSTWVWRFLLYMYDQYTMIIY